MTLISQILQFFRAHKKKIYSFAIFAIILQIPLVAFTSRSPKGIFYSNQTLYYLHGVRAAGAEFLQNDPDISGPPYHWLFSQLVFLLQELNILAIGSQLIESLLITILALSPILLVFGLHKNWIKKDTLFISLKRPCIEIGIIVALVFVFIFETGGHAGMNIISGYLQSSEFGVFIIVGIGLALLEFWWLAALCLFIASAMHSSYLIMAALIILIMAFELYQQGKLTLGLKITICFAILTLPFFIIGPLQWSSVNSQEANIIITQFRSPHHYVVSSWWDFKDTIRLIVIAFATMVSFFKGSSFLKKLMLFFFVYSYGGVLLEWWTGNSTISSLLPWRASAFIFPISQIVLLAFIFSALTSTLSSSKREITSQMVIMSLLILTTMWNVYQNPFDWPPAMRDFESAEIEMIKTYTSQTDMLLVPTAFPGEFRIYAERPIFVLKKTTGFDVVEWYDRLQYANMFLNADIEYQNSECENEYFDYYLLNRLSPAAEFADPVASTEDYLLIACEK